MRSFEGSRHHTKSDSRMMYRSHREHYHVIYSQLRYCSPLFPRKEAGETRAKDYELTQNGYPHRLGIHCSRIALNICIACSFRSTFVVIIGAGNFKAWVHYQLFWHRLRRLWCCECGGLSRICHLSCCSHRSRRHDSSYWRCAGWRGYCTERGCA
jgi:hypothetical protein